MSYRIAAIAWVLAMLARMAYADSSLLRGSIADSTTHAPITGVEVRLTSSTDSAAVRHITTLDDGAFRFDALPAGAWKLEAWRMGYVRLTRTLQFTGGQLDLGALFMKPSPLSLPEVQVHSSPPPAVQRGDTTEFSSGAVKTHPDATAEELVGKLPGMTVDKNGTVKSNGETIEQVLVNGKPYFGSDPTLALRNLPAEVIEKIQVFDKLSDQSEFTGIDDGQTTKTMNVILRSDHPVTFGKTYGGGDGDGRYAAGGDANAILGDTRIAVVGLSNNINQQNFSSQDILGVLSTGN